MEKELWQDYFNFLGDAVSRLRELIKHPDLKTVDYLQDATIQRFEFCIELYWKILKKFLSYEEVETSTPRDVLKKAYQFNLIDDEKMWIQIIHDRNKSSHVYNQAEAKKIFEHILVYWPVIEKNFEKLKIKFYS
ncbi:MAG: nucleotidyltransferase substrate binding protein [Alphaproteobacteria bacterium]|nr:nucleotidyltransferase substrate binding protein [Alphaproteobacteria bacterium]